MPIKGEHFEAFRLFRTDAPEQREHQNEHQHHQPDHDMRGVKPNERVKRSAEQIGMNGQPILIDELVPLVGSAGEEEDP